MYIHLLTKIKNAQALQKESVRFPHSKMDESILEVLARTGYIASFEKKGKNPKKFFDIQLAYKNGEGKIQGIRFISTPSRRLYKKTTELRSVRQGYGTAFISTSSGIMTNKDARTKKIGGQILFTIW